MQKSEAEIRHQTFANSFSPLFSGRREEVRLPRMFQALHAERPPGETHQNPSEQKRRELWRRRGGLDGIGRFLRQHHHHGRRDHPHPRQHPAELQQRPGHPGQRRDPPAARHQGISQRSHGVIRAPRMNFSYCILLPTFLLKF